jgi:translation initiation factor 2 subunit 1
VSPEDVVRCQERFEKSKRVNSVMRHVSGATQLPLEPLYQAIAWPLNKKYGHAYDAFKMSITDPSVWEGMSFPSDKTKEELLDYIKKRMTPNPTKVRADIEVTCFSIQGIDAIKIALREAEGASTPEAAVKVRLVSPPLYVLTSQCLDKQIGLTNLEKAIEAVTASIQHSGGECRVKMAPKAITETDEEELAALMARRERENAEVSGDDDESSDDDDAVPAV